MKENLHDENERAQFKDLIAKNPNYFGSIKDKETIARFTSVKRASFNTTYEELLCVGLYPEANLLEAVIEIKKPDMHSGPLCSEGTMEYVAFYIDYNDGAGFVSTGAPVEVNVHDLAFIETGEHVFYAVHKPFIPKKLIYCEQPQIVKVRAILSWQQIPTGPNYAPEFGNVINVWVQIKPRRKIIINPPYELALDKELLIGRMEDIMEFGKKTLQPKYNEKEIELIGKERVEFKELIRINPNYFGSIVASREIEDIKIALLNLPTSELFNTFLDKLELLKPRVINLSGTALEELKCVGLYPEGDLLEAIIEVKKDKGFDGDLCTLGSKEYVAFYIDWDGNGNYQHEGTSIVRVHDIPFVNQNQHLFYAVKAKIQDIESKLKLCTVENIVKVKAILSWNQDPTPFGPNFVPSNGNVLIRNIQIRPKDGESVKCNISIVNQVHVNDIMQSGADVGLAIKIDGENNAIPGIHDRPFGGIVACWGKINITPAGDYYRFQYSVDGGTTWKNITDKRITANSVGLGAIIRAPDIEGWFSINEYNDDEYYYGLASLVQWKSSGKQGPYSIRLQIGDSNKIPYSNSDPIHLMLDNTNPELLTFAGTSLPLPALGITVKDENGLYKKCENFNAPEPIK
ncbi:MAG: hypothetical protein ACFE8P_17170, partial [Promethearchaeota archaeon]